MKTVFEFGGPNPYTIPTGPVSLIHLRQSAAEGKRFSLQYGIQIEQGLTYSQACKALGQALMHHLACEGVLNNNGE
jgi:hypothetical protein